MLFYEKEYIKSIDANNKAIQYNQGLASAWFNRVISKYYISDYIGMNNDLDTAITLEPNNIQYINLK